MKEKTKKKIHSIINIGIAVTLIGGMAIPIVLSLLDI
jgi:hypothetical protein